MGTPAHDRVAEVRRLVAAHLPGYDGRAVIRLGGGTNNTAYEIGGALIVRFSNEPDAARRAETVIAEARLLDAVASIVPVAVPRPVFVAAEDGCLAYFKVEGVPLIDLREPRRSHVGLSIATALGDVLTAMHTAPVARMSELVGRDDEPLSGWQREAAELYGSVAAHLPQEQRAGVEAFIAAAPPPAASTAVFSHNDLGIEHLLVDAEACTLSGVIDWSDAAIVDPAADFGRLLRDLSDTAFERVMRSYGAAGEPLTALCGRAEFYARCMVLEDLAYGLEPELAVYLQKSLVAAERLFGR